MSPPRAATWLLASLHPDGERAPLIGDLAEEYTLRAQLQQAPNATRWYWRQSLRSLPPVFWGGFRQGKWRGALGAALSAYIFVFLVESGFQVALARLLGAESLVRMLLSLLIGLAAMVGGGFVAEWMRRGAAAALAIIIGTTTIVLMITLGHTSPRWYQVIFLVLGPAQALIGGALLRRRQAARPIDPRAEERA